MSWPAARAPPIACSSSAARRCCEGGTPTSLLSSCRIGRAPRRGRRRGSRPAPGARGPGCARARRRRPAAPACASASAGSPRVELPLDREQGAEVAQDRVVRLGRRPSASRAATAPASSFCAELGLAPPSAGPARRSRSCPRLRGPRTGRPPRPGGRRLSACSAAAKRSASAARALLAPMVPADLARGADDDQHGHGHDQGAVAAPEHARAGRAAAPRRPRG